MKRLLAILGIWTLVWTEDHDGEVRLRRARYTRFGKWITCGILSHPVMVLLPNGDIACGIYVQRWKEWEHNKNHVVFPKEKP